MRLRSLGRPRFAFLPRLGFAVGHKGPLSDFDDFDFADLHFVIEICPANTMGATEIVYAPVHASGCR